MNRLWVETFSQAVTALTDHKLRTALSVLGITIGIAAVMAVSTVSKGGNYVVFSELETFGLNSIWVYRDFDDDSPYRQQRRGSGIENADLLAIQQQAEALGVRRVSPIFSERRETVKNGGQFAGVSILGVNGDYLGIVNDSLQSGRTFNNEDINSSKLVAIIGPEIAEKLYRPGVNPVGQTLVYDARRLHVIGVLAPKNRDFLASIGSEGGQNANDRLLIPYTALQKIKGNRHISHLQIEVSEFEHAEATAKNVSDLLRRRHRRVFDYSYETMAGYIKTTDSILGGVAIVGIVAASISLLVGGMGILNMMSTAVLERTREIGIRKAVGASEGDIQHQFLLEAILISVVGGVLGLLIGVLASVILARVTGFPVIPSVQAIVGALLVSVLVGILAGYLPARRAAKLHPVEALRSG